MEKIFTWHNAVISYRTEGKGQPVVLLHGFGEDSHIWDGQISFLKEHCLLIVPDLPGSGKSQMIGDVSNASENTHDSRLTSPEITIDDYASIIHDLLQQENISSCIMLGHSMGGYITLAFAEKYAVMLSAFGLINSTAYADSEEKKKTREKAIKTIDEYGAFSFMKTTTPSLFGATFKKGYPEKVEELVNDSQQFSKEALQQYYRAMISRPDRTHVLKSNPLPVLFVTATEDGPAPMNDVLQQTHLPVKSYIHVLQGVGHMSMWEATEELNNYLLDFISQ